MKKTWSDKAWNGYMYWYDQGNKKMIRKINNLIKDIERHPFDGLGKPEPLKHELSGKWSRRITGEHRLVYLVEDNQLYIFSVIDHY
ncbi:Txe/YoeB family addiction module toxin [Companilactobacillus jidongensis]|uniref:Txe/YoeB family addiction module toxin n=1 Tax=Companilactobacillus jidongensis TaxID=2486006 RepID=UPI000F76997B|nr:Txe/YoeB family addiction module toxin [Companilactobacillus jidongensis]